MSNILSFDSIKKEAVDKGGVCLSTVYSNSHTKLLWRCAEGHEWWATPHHIWIAGKKLSRIKRERDAKRIEVHNGLSL